MNLLEHYIVKIISEEDVTDEFADYMRKETGKEYDSNEKMFEVKLLADCYGHLSEYTKWWRESEYESVKRCGFWLD